MLRHCSLGNHTAPIEDFYKDCSSKDGMYHSCKVHVKIRNKKYTEANKGKIKAKRLRNRAQLNACKSFNKWNLIGGMSRREAFIDAICASSDEKYENAPDGSIEKWLAILKAEGVKQPQVWTGLYSNGDTRTEYVPIIPNYCSDCAYHERGNDFSKDMCLKSDKRLTKARLGTKRGNQIPIMRCGKFIDKAELKALGWSVR